jgi:hypothetical protein
VLAFCIFEKKTYANEVTSLMHRMKFKHFGHDAAVLHEREIRKAQSPFQFLQNAERRAVFIADIRTLIERSAFTLVAAVIDKEKLGKRYGKPDNPYHLALRFGLERIEMHRAAQGDKGLLHVVFEARGKTEDQALELEFRRVCGENAVGYRLQMEPIFAHKHANHCGLQFADLVARPIGVHVLRPQQRNRAYETLAAKFRASPEGKIEGWGLKCFP